MSRSNSKSRSTSEARAETSSRASVHPTSRRLALADPLQSSQPYISPYGPAPSISGSSRSTPGISTASTYLNLPFTTLSRGSSVSSEDFAALDFHSQSTMSSSKTLTAADKAKLIKSLEAHSVNTLVELRRIEKVLANAPDATGPMTNAWAHYVNSNNLLSELRGLTKNYPFSSECLDEAKWMVISDPQSSRSWNYCWLVLQKARNQNLVPKHARQLAARPEMWGGKQPTTQSMEQLANACSNEWSRALNQLLRHWDTAPTLPGR